MYELFHLVSFVSFHFAESIYQFKFWVEYLFCLMQRIILSVNTDKFTSSFHIYVIFICIFCFIALGKNFNITINESGESALGSHIVSPQVRTHSFLLSRLSEKEISFSELLESLKLPISLSHPRTLCNYPRSPCNGHISSR